MAFKRNTLLVHRKKIFIPSGSFYRHAKIRRRSDSQMYKRSTDFFREVCGEKRYWDLRSGTVLHKQGYDIRVVCILAEIGGLKPESRL